MSALPPIATKLVRRNEAQCSKKSSLSHLIGADERRRRHVERYSRNGCYGIWSGRRRQSAYAVREMAEAGGLMSYGTQPDGCVASGRHLYRLHPQGCEAGGFAGRQASKFELVINAATARMLGLTVPDKLLVAADEVFE